jgi:hypothetical protein
VAARARGRLQDSRGVTVLSPDATFAKGFTHRTVIKMKFGVDAISAASDLWRSDERIAVTASPGH